VFSDLDLEVRTRARQRRIREAPARAPIRVEVSRAPRRCRRGRESGRSEQEAREHNRGKRSSMNCGHRIPPRCAPRAFLGDKDIGVTSCDLQKRSLGDTERALFPAKRAKKEGYGRGRSAPGSLGGRRRRRLPLAHASPEEGGEGDDRDDDQDARDDQERVLTARQQGVRRRARGDRDVAPHGAEVVTRSRCPVAPILERPRPVRDGEIPMQCGPEVRRRRLRPARDVVAVVVDEPPVVEAVQRGQVQRHVVAHVHGQRRARGREARVRQAPASGAAPEQRDRSVRGRGRRRDRRTREEGGRDAQSHDECRTRF